MTQILSIENLTVGIGLGENQVVRLSQISLDLYANEILGLVGPSGAGKSLTGLSILGLHTDIGAKILEGKIIYQYRDHKVELSSFSADAYTQIRGKEIGIIFQEASTALNPTQRIGKQLLEAYSLSEDYKSKDAKKYVIDLLRKVRIEDPERIYISYPHQVSGGQAQRVMIAMVLCMQPSIIIADEATSSLDSITQREIIELLKDLKVEYTFAMIWISHNLALTTYLCDRVVTIQEGRIVHSRSQRVITNTAKWNSDNSHRVLSKESLLSLDSVSMEYQQDGTFFRNRGSFTKALDIVSLQVKEGQLLGLIGRSGSGKSTIANLMTRVISSSSGKIYYRGKDIHHFSSIESKRYSKDVQIIYQNPEASLDPIWKISEVLKEPIRVHQIYTSAEEIQYEMIQLIELLQLPADTLDRYPHQFSGGQRQRIAIARALLIKPHLLICDECIASLDVDNQRIILDVIQDYNQRFNMSVLFISHNLAVVRDLVDEILIMNEGRIVHETSPGDLDSISDAYVQNLLTSCEF